jgi:FlaA1/EpsC-like NDP-sugar epimerase
LDVTMTPAPSPIAQQPLWRRPILIGTAATLPTLWERVVAEGISPVGYLFVDHPDLSEDAPRSLGSLDSLPTLQAIDPFTAAIVSLPAAEGPMILKVRSVLRACGIVERFVPTLADALCGSAPARSLPGEVDLVELIGRTPYGIDRRAVERVLAGKRVLVTGAGGSIGSELCRIACTFQPEMLIMMERSENALFEIDRQIARRFPGVQRRALLHDVVDAEQTLRHLVSLRPHAVFHAAAHKHVPLMEDHPSHAVSNNLFGTKSIADAAMAVGAERFVMISSDKAVNPSSVMGATKRLAEMYVQHLGVLSHSKPRAKSSTSFSMVRFGNVLGSACSVLPIWSHQLAEGGPITVTDPRMTRYFMTINEAASLVIQASAIEPRGEQSPSIYVLDMGEPLKIAELAQRFVRLQGFDARLPDDPDAREGKVSIVFTGARPGEKLHEELSYPAEALLPTPFPGIMALASSAGEDFDVTGMLAEFSGLRTHADREAVLAAIRRHVPEMAPAQGSRTLAA